MRRGIIFLVIGAIFTFVLVSVKAQGRSIAETIASRPGDFSILQEFIDAAPEIADVLAADGSFTFFAPNNTAFENLEATSGIPLEVLIEDVDVVTALLQYHIVEQRLTTVALRQADSSLETMLEGAGISVEVNDNNVITLNGDAGIVNTPSLASNGIVYEVNAVIIHRFISDLISENISFTPEPTATPTETAEPDTPTPLPATATATPTDTPEPVTASPEATETVSTPVTTPSVTLASVANVRLIHLAIDAPAIELTLGSEVIVESLEPGEVTEFIAARQGIYTATVSSLDNDENFEFDVDLTLLNGDFVTILLVGSLAEDSLLVMELTEDFDDLDEDESRVILYHALEDTPEISLLLDDEFVIEGVDFAEFETIDISSAVYSLSVVETRNNDEILLEIDEQTLEAGAFYFFALYDPGQPDEPLILETTQDEILRLQSGGTESGGETGDDRSTDSIFGILQSDEETFSILVSMFEAAPASILRRVEGEDSDGDGEIDTYTLLAPSNQAFENLLASAGYGRNTSRLLNNTPVVTDILLYHLVEDELRRQAFIDLSGTSIETLLTRSAFFVRAANNGTIFLNGTVEFARTDILASNGVIHVVDDVLLPQSVLDALGF